MYSHDRTQKSELQHFVRNDKPFAYNDDPPWDDPPFPLDNETQGTKKPSFEEPEELAVEEDEPDLDLDDHTSILEDDSQDSLDPLGLHVQRIVLKLLADKDHFTLKDFQDSESIPASESAIRDRLNQLVSFGKLRSVPGRGRRASIYLAPEKGEDSETKTGKFTNEELLEILKEEETQLREELEEVRKKLDLAINEKKAVETTIALHKKHSQDK